MSLPDPDRYDGEDAGPDPDSGDESGIAQLDDAETLLQDGYDPLDEGWSPPEKPRGLDAWGVTSAEEHAGEPLDERLRREQPELGGPGGDGDDPAAEIGDAADTDGELRDGEVGDRRAGRLVASEDGEDGAGVEDDRWADDVGIDGAAASAEEAAVHLIDDDGRGQP